MDQSTVCPACEGFGWMVFRRSPTQGTVRVAPADAARALRNPVPDECRNLKLDWWLCLDCFGQGLLPGIDVGTDVQPTPEEGGERRVSMSMANPM
jgi:hypothetical protein